MDDENGNGTAVTRRELRLELGRFRAEVRLLVAASIAATYLEIPHELIAPAAGAIVLAGVRQLLTRGD